MTTDLQQYNSMSNQIVVYSSDDNVVRLDVYVADETVWLTQQQMALLFGKDQSVIARHIANIFKEGELDKSNMQILHNTQFKYRPTAVYNLDVIISVGYRVKSKQGIFFRQWANKVLKDYLLRGYVVNQLLLDMQQQMDLRLGKQDDRLSEIENQLSKHQNQIEYFVRTALPPREGIFMDGQIYDAYECVTRLIKSAKKEIVLIDNYVDESTITMMSNKQNGVNVDIYTMASSLTAVVHQTENKFNSQYGGLALHAICNIHDRFLILDDTTIYLIGASLKDAGKKLFAFTQMDATHITELKAKL